MFSCKCLRDSSRCLLRRLRKWKSNLVILLFAGQWRLVELSVEPNGAHWNLLLVNKATLEKWNSYVQVNWTAGLIWFEQIAAFSVNNIRFLAGDAYRYHYSEAGDVLLNLVEILKNPGPKIRQHWKWKPASRFLSVRKIRIQFQFSLNFIPKLESDFFHMVKMFG